MNRSNWFLKYWYFLFFPAFICAAGTQWSTTLPGAVVGSVCALALVSIAVNMEGGSLDNIKWYTKILIFVVIPIIVLLLVAFMSSSNMSMFPGADINNPFLDHTKNFWRAVISGIGGIFATLVGLGVAKLFSSKSMDETKSIDPL
jgi:uncharacterized membrane protein